MISSDEMHKGQSLEVFNNDWASILHYAESTASEALKEHIDNFRLNEQQPSVETTLRGVLARVIDAVQTKKMNGYSRVVDARNNPITDDKQEIETAILALTDCRRLFSKLASFSINRQELDHAGSYVIRFELRPKDFAQTAALKADPETLPNLEQSEGVNQLVEQVRNAESWWTMTERLRALSQRQVLVFDKKTGKFWDPKKTLDQLAGVRIALAQNHPEQADALLPLLSEAANIKAQAETWLRVIKKEYKTVLNEATSLDELLTALSRLETVIKAFSAAESGKSSDAPIDKIIEVIRYVNNVGLGKNDQNLKYVTDRLGIKNTVKRLLSK